MREKIDPLPVPPNPTPDYFVSAYYLPSHSEPVYGDVVYNGKKIECAKIEIGSNEYALCDASSYHRGCSKKKGVFGRGLINDEKDPFHVERCGNLGEMAFGKLFGLPVDFTFRQRGDNGDFSMGKYSVNVKTATYNYWTGLVRVYKSQADKDADVRIALDADLFVFGWLGTESRDKKNSIVYLAGYHKKEYIFDKCDIKPARKGREHFNYEVPFVGLSPIRQLLEKWRNK